MRITLLCGFTAGALLLGGSAAMGKSFCKGTVDSETGYDTCSTKRCETDWPKGKIHNAECDDRGKCPISTDAIDKGHACYWGKEKGHDVYTHGCKLIYSKVTECGPL